MDNGIAYNPEWLFNTPLEVGLRCLIILAEAAQPCDLHRLKILDYFLLHSEDIEHGTASLHPPSPFRTGELLVRHSLIEQGVRLLVAKGLVSPRVTKLGIAYEATNVAGSFLSYFESEYAVKARAIAQWIERSFGSLDNVRLQAFVNEHVGQWGTEFAVEPLAEEETD